MVYPPCFWIHCLLHGYNRKKKQRAYTLKNQLPMITLLYVSLIILLMVAPVLLLGYAESRHLRQTRKKLLHQFDQEVAGHQLRISGQELLHQAIVGVDGQQKKLVVAWKEEEGFYRSRVVDLQSLQHCAVLEDLHTDPEDSLFRKQQLIVDRIVLQLNCTAWPLTQIPFYDASQQSRRLLPRMRQKACKWKTLVTQLVPAAALTRRTAASVQPLRG